MDARFCAFHTSLRHMGYANTLGLAKLGVTADFSVEGGVVVLGDDDMPEGLLKENAYFAVFQRSIHTASTAQPRRGAFSALIRGSRRSTPSKPTPSMPPSAAHGIMPSVQSLPDTMRILCSFPEIR